MSRTCRTATGQGRGLSPVLTTTAAWASQLVPRLFAPPARWGWPSRTPADWLPARSKAVTRAIWRLALLVVAAFAFTTRSTNPT